MPAKTKICGLTTAGAVAASLRAGADYLGFVFFRASPRAIQPQAAAGFAAFAGGKAKIVAVMVDPEDWLVDAVAAALAPDLIQLHGDEDPARAREIGERAGAGVIKAIPVSEAADLAAAVAYDSTVDHLMFDAKAPGGAGRPGGLGARFDPSLLAGRRWSRPWFLAGGLDPGNVAGAIRASGAPAVDVSTGVESAPGLKDPALIDAFLAATRGA